MIVTVTFDLDKKYRDEEKKATSAQDFLETIIYDYQCGMVCINKIHVDSRRFSTTIVPSKDDEE